MSAKKPARKAKPARKTKAGRKAKLGTRAKPARKAKSGRKPNSDSSAGAPAAGATRGADEPKSGARRRAGAKKPAARRGVGSRRKPAPDSAPTAEAPAWSGVDRLPMSLARPESQQSVFCNHFGRCGGCSLLDLAYADELAGKTEALRQLVEQELGQAPLLPELGAARPHFYRTAIKVPFGRVRKGPVCGFFRRGSHSIVDLHECAIQHPLLTEIVLRTRQLVADLHINVYCEETHRGTLRHLLARVAPGTGQALVGLVTLRGGSPAIRRLATALMDEFGSRGLVGVVENVNERKTSAIHGTSTHRLAGRATLQEQHDGLKVRTSITSFVQINAEQASVLYAQVLKLLGPMKGRHVCELFAGYGPIALRLAQAGARVTAIEHNPAAVEDGIAAARLNGLSDRVRFQKSDALLGLRRVDAEGLDALVVDPPRRGLGSDLCRLITELAVPRLAYVSCNAESLMRDLKQMQGHFKLEALQPVDLFPRTDHLELVALLSRRRG